MTEKEKKIKEPARRKSAKENFWELKLYVAGKTLRSITAIENLEKFCEEHLKGRYKITVSDLK